MKHLRFVSHDFTYAINLQTIFDKTLEQKEMLSFCSLCLQLITPIKKINQLINICI